MVTIDDFNQIASRHIKRRETIAESIEALIVEAVVELNLWLMRSKVDDVIGRLRKRQEEIVAVALDEVKAYAEETHHHIQMEPYSKGPCGPLSKNQLIR